MSAMLPILTKTAINDIVILPHCLDMKHDTYGLLLERQTVPVITLIGLRFYSYCQLSIYLSNFTEINVIELAYPLFCHEYSV